VPEVSVNPEMLQNTLCEALGMSILKADPQCVVMTMPVNKTTHQPFGLLHGGASVALAESIASIGTALSVDPKKQAAVGLEINANHIRSKQDGIVTGTGRPLHQGRRTHVWEIRIEDEAGSLICISRCTVAIVDLPPKPNHEK
jgi:1,4-dihydroxy-2-naphthoyl-CoA hydrolase